MPEPEKQQDQLDEAKMIFVKSPDYRTFYSNQVQFATTAFDFALIFGQIEEVTADGARATIEQHARIVMSPLQFKLFTIVCAQNIKNYESRFGKIQPPTGPGIEPIPENWNVEQPK